MSRAAVSSTDSNQAEVAAVAARERKCCKCAMAHLVTHQGSAQDDLHVRERGIDISLGVPKWTVQQRADP
jgi:alkylhydroperoxidase family enzyme